MASLSPEEKIEFLLQLLVTSGEFSPNYGGLATKMGINTNANAQRRLKGIVEADKRFVLQSSGGTARVVPLDDVDKATSGSDTVKKAPKSAKGRKRAMSGGNDGEGNDDSPKPAKKSKKGRPGEAGLIDSKDDQEEIIANEEAI